MCHLVLEDNIRASAACRSWREAGVSVRVVEIHPWLMWFPVSSNLFRLFDPLQSKSYTLDLPELADSIVCYSRDGWLLMHRSSSSDMFFFNPFTRELISLPKFERPLREIAFSCPPTSDNCVVLALNFDGDDHLTISTCHPGATEWITKHFFVDSNQLHTHMKLLYVNDRFYCYCLDSCCLYSFRQSSSAWKFHVSARISGSLDYKFDEREVCMAEKNGELFLMFTSRGEKLTVYKLVSSKWEEMTSTTLDGLTMFFSSYNSELRTNLPWMRNNVYFSRLGNDLKHCLSYSFDESMRPNENWLELCPSQSLWINPPKNVLDYL